MKVNDVQRVAGIQSYHKDATPNTPGKGGPKTKKTDEVQISREAFQLQSSQDTDRVERIEGLKERVSTGTYRVDAGLIAERLLPYIQK